MARPCALVVGLRVVRPLRRLLRRPPLCRRPCPLFRPLPRPPTSSSASSACVVFVVRRLRHSCATSATWRLTIHCFNSQQPPFSETGTFGAKSLNRFAGAVGGAERPATTPRRPRDDPDDGRQRSCRRETGCNVCSVKGKKEDVKVLAVGAGRGAPRRLCASSSR